MKNPLLTLLFVLACSTGIFAQNVPGEKLVPAAVKTKFKAEYPSAVIKRWEVKAVVKEYIAVFTDNNLAKRARYKADGTPIFLHIHYPAAAVPAAYTPVVMAAYPGFKVDWANEWKNFRNGNHVIELRLNKPGYVLKAYVKPDGTVITDKKSMEDTGDEMQTEESGETK